MSDRERMVTAVFCDWLTWLDSHDGRLYRRKVGGKETESDLVALVPSSGTGRHIFTLGDLRALVGMLSRAD